MVRRMHGLRRIFDGSCRCLRTAGKASSRLRFRVPVGPFAGLVGDCAGVTVVMLALSLSLVAGVAGLGTEAASWYAAKRTMQGAADASASAAALALAASEASSTFTTLARSVAASYNFVNGSNGTTVTVNYPPASGSYTGSAAVEVVINQT